MSSEKNKWVERGHPDLSISRQCELLGLNRSGFYYEPIAESAENLSIMATLDRLHTAYPFYGVRRMTINLGIEFQPINDKRVRRLMRLMGIEANYPRLNLSKKNEGHQIYPYLLRGVEIDRPMQVWSTDITYVPMAQGFMYLCAVMDWHSRFITAWRLSNSLTVGFCKEALEESLDLFGCPKIPLFLGDVKYQRSWHLSTRSFDKCRSAMGIAYGFGSRFALSHAVVRLGFSRK